MDLIDFIDPGMHGVFLVRDSRRFAKQMRLENDDIEPSFGLRYDEWLSILIEAFNIDEKFDDTRKKELREKKIILELSEELPGFPFFSRIKNYINDVIFELDEVHTLKEECTRLLDLTSSQKSRRGIEKMIIICDWAVASSKDIYLLGK